MKNIGVSIRESGCTIEALNEAYGRRDAPECPDGCLMGGGSIRKSKCLASPNQNLGSRIQNINDIKVSHVTLLRPLCGVIHHSL